MNLLSAIDKFSAYLINEKNYSGNTLMGYVRDLNDLYKFIASGLEDSASKIELQYIDEQTLKNFIGSLVLHSEPKYSKQTISRKISTLKSFYKFLNRKKIYSENPSRNLIFPKLSRNLPTVLDEKAINELLDSSLFAGDIWGIRDRAIIELFYCSGIRLSELINLNPDNIDFKNCTIKVRGKGRKERIIPVGNIAAGSIAAYLDKRDEHFGERGMDYDSNVVFNGKNGRSFTQHY